MSFDDTSRTIPVSKAMDYPWFLLTDRSICANLPPLLPNNPAVGGFVAPGAPWITSLPDRFVCTVFLPSLILLLMAPQESSAVDETGGNLAGPGELLDAELFIKSIRAGKSL